MATQWSNFTRAVVISISLLVIGWLVYAMRPLITPLIIAALLAYILHPLVKLVQTRTRLGHTWGVSLVYFSGLTLLIVIPSVLAPIAIRQIKGLSSHLVNIETRLEAALAKPISLAGQELHLGQILANFLKATEESLAPAAEGALAVIETTSTSLVWLLVILVSTYYLLLDGGRLRDWFLRLAPESIQPDLRRLLQEINAVWQAYLSGTFVLMVVVGIVFAIVWTAIGLPGGVALGLLTGLLSIIPEIGPAFAAILAVLVAFFQGSDFLPLSDFWFAALVLGIYFVLIQIKAIWLRPRIMGRFLHMHEGLIFVIVIGAAVIWGILGALLIIPLWATMGVIGHYIRCRLLYLEPWPAEASLTLTAAQNGVEAAAASRVTQPATQAIAVDMPEN